MPVRASRSSGGFSGFKGTDDGSPGLDVFSVLARVVAFALVHPIICIALLGSLWYCLRARSKKARAPLVPAIQALFREMARAPVDRVVFSTFVSREQDLRDRALQNLDAVKDDGQKCDDLRSDIKAAFEEGKNHVLDAFRVRADVRLVPRMCAAQLVAIDLLLNEHADRLRSGSAAPELAKATEDDARAALVCLSDLCKSQDHLIEDEQVESLLRALRHCQH